MITTAAAAVAHLMLIAGWMLALGYPLVGPFEVIGLLMLGAVPAALYTGWRLWWPLATAGAGLLAAAGLELALPGPTVAVLGTERVTTGVAVLARYALSWPLVLALVLLAGLAERVRRIGRVRWTRALAGAVVSALAVTGLVLLDGLVRGWASPPALPWGWVGLVVLGFAAVLPAIRPGLLAPPVVLGVALAVAAIASWVQPAGDPVAGLLGSTSLYTTVALAFGLVELLARTLARVGGRAGPPGSARRARLGTLAERQADDAA